MKDPFQPPRWLLDARAPKGMYFDKTGEPILYTATWAQLFEDFSYRRVAETLLPNGIRVSTAWSGINHRFSSYGPPLIFESMAFAVEVSHAESSEFLPAFDYRKELDCMRYSTESQAIVGHAAMCDKFFAGCLLLPPPQE